MAPINLTTRELWMEAIGISHCTALRRLPRFRTPILLMVLMVALLIQLCTLSLLSAVELDASSEKRDQVFEKDVFKDWDRVYDALKKQDPFYPKQPVFAYYANRLGVELVNSESSNDNASPLPDELLISPGKYSYRGQCFDLKKEGLYRFLEIGKDQQQRIVYHGDVPSLLSSYAWIFTHGNADNHLSDDKIQQAAKTRKLCMTCGNVSEWASRTLNQLGIRTRLVSSITLEPWNNFDNGHVMIEVYREELAKWVLYDLDGNRYFTWQQKPLTLVEFSYAVLSDREYTIELLSNDTSQDVSNFKSLEDSQDYALFFERDIAAPRQWLRRVMQVPMILDPSVGRCFFDHENRERIESYGPNPQEFHFMEKEEFRKRFYGKKSLEIDFSAEK